MVLKLEITREDLLDFNLYHMQRSCPTCKRTLRYRILFPIVLSLLLAVFYLLYPNVGGPWFWIPLLLGIVVLWALFVDKLLQRDIRRKVRKYKTDGGYAPTGECTLSFLEDRIIDDSKWYSATVTYDQVKRIAVAEESMYLYVGPGAAIIVPFRCFADQTEQQGFLDFLNRKCGPSLQQHNEQEQEQCPNEHYRL